MAGEKNGGGKKKREGEWNRNESKKAGIICEGGKERGKRRMVRSSTHVDLLHSIATRAASVFGSTADAA